MARLQLFDGDGGSDDDVSKIEINKDFAKRFEHNKKREELQRYEELKKKGVVESSSSDSEDSSSEDDDLIKPSKKKDSMFFDALIKVKNQDPILRNKDAKLFDSGSDDEDDDDGVEEHVVGEENSKDEKKKKKKAMYLKDVVSKQLIESGPELIEDEDEPNDDVENKVMTYNEEQDALRKEFLEAVERDDNDEGELLKVKSKESDEDEDAHEEIVEKLDEYFGMDGNLDEDTKFLKEYFRNRLWIDEGKDDGIDDDEIEFSEDEEEIERQEDYEREYNFRFEENAGDRVMSHSRNVEGSVRKKESVRKLQRERKKERKAQAEFERKEELKRLKNLKKKEINEKLQKIREVAGIGKEGVAFFDEADIENEFDPEEYDKKMKKAFDDGYYEAEDVDPKFGSDKDDDDDGFEKPDFDKEDELLGLPKGWDEINEETRNGFTSARGKILKNRAVNVDNNEVSEEEKALREQLLDEYHKLDYEDTIGDLKTRFKYRSVKSKRFGLSPEELLTMDDKELNQYVSLKKIAPYREKEWKVPRAKTIQLKQRAKEIITGQSSTGIKDKDAKKRKYADSEASEVTKESEKKSQSNGDENTTMSSKAKRRRCQAELKLSRSRLMAYGKIPSKPKGKNQ